MDWSYQVGWDYFSRWVESFPDDQIDDDPSQKKSTSQLPLEASKIFNTAGDVQHPRAETKMVPWIMTERQKSENQKFNFCRINILMLLLKICWPYQDVYFQVFMTDWPRL